MKFGCFGFARHIPLIEHAGFDSAELDICEIAAMNGGEFVRQVRLPNCQTMCDLRHMHKLGESMAEITACRSYIRHAHIDYPEGVRRFFPQETDGFDYGPYFQALSDAGYDGLLTVEATDYDDFQSETKRSLKLRKRYAEKYSC